MEMAPVALSVAPALQEAAASGIWMQELSHPLMGLLCRAGDHPRQPPPHAACCCCAGRDRLAAGVRCSWRSTLGVVSCLTKTFLWGAVPSATPQCTWYGYLYHWYGSCSFTMVRVQASLCSEGIPLPMVWAFGPYLYQRYRPFGLPHHTFQLGSVMV